jgi:hypothetical protein
MAPSLLDMFQTLTSFEPQRGSLRGAPWEDFVDWAIAQGLGPLAAYNLEYRLGGGEAPEWARDRLLSVYQGTVNDNVMTLVHFKRVVGVLEGRKLLLLGGAAFADALYPHGGFRPVLAIQVLLRRLDVEGFSGFLAQQEFKPTEDELDSGATRVLSDGRTWIQLFADVLGPSRREELKGVFERALPHRLYGPSLFRPDLEDAVLLVCLEQARHGYQLPWLSYVDLRELVTGASWMGGVYSRPLNAQVLRARAREWRLERALYTSLSILARLYPQTAPAVEGALPPLRRATRELLNRLVVEPASEVGRASALRGTDRLRRLLTGQ